jgi:hypothetical protein
LFYYGPGALPRAGIMPPRWGLRDDGRSLSFAHRDAGTESNGKNCQELLPDPDFPTYAIRCTE